MGGHPPPSLPRRAARGRLAEDDGCLLLNHFSPYIEEFTLTGGAAPEWLSVVLSRGLRQIKLKGSTASFSFQTPTGRRLFLRP